MTPGLTAALSYLISWAVSLLVFFLPVVLMFPSLSSLPRLKYRAPYALAMVQTLTAVCIASVYLIHLAFPPALPCPFLLWIPALALPTLLFCLLSRYVHLGFQFWTAANKLAQGRQRDRGGLAAEAGALNSSGAEVREDIEAGQISLRLGEQARWRLRLLGVFRVANLARLGVILMLFQTVALVIVQATNKTMVWSAPTCPMRTAEWILTWAGAASVLAIALPPAVIAISGVRDAYGIRLELDISLAIFILSVISQALMISLAPRVPWFAKAYDIVGNGQIWVFCALSIHFITIVLPMFETWRAAAIDLHQKQSGLLKPPPMRRADKYGVSDLDSPERPDFERIMLDDPKLLREFRLFAVREFTVERILFFERYKRARTAAEEAEQSTPQGPGRIWREQYKKIYFDFLRPNAEMALVDVEDRVLLMARKEFRAETFDVNVLDNAAEQVWGAIWRETYPKFLLEWRKKVRADMRKQTRWGRRREGSRVGAAALGIPVPGRKLSSAVLRKGSRAVAAPSGAGPSLSVPGAARSP